VAEGEVQTRYKMVLKKTKNGWKIVSLNKGKTLGIFKTKKEALQRLKQIEYFKNLKNRYNRKGKK